MPAYDGAGTLFARGLRLTHLDSSGAPMVGANHCYVTDALVTIGVGLAFTENETIEQRNGRGQVCVAYRAPDTLLNATIESLTVCTPDPNILSFLIGGAVIIGGGTDEVQTLTITGTPTGGTFTLTFDGQETDPIDYDATAGEVQTALEALPNLTPGDVTAGGGPLPDTPVTLTFGGSLAGTDVPLIVADGSSLTGGTTPDVAVAVTTPGVDGDTIGWRAPEVNTDPVPNGVAIECWTNAIADNAPAANLPYWHHVFPRCRLRLSDTFTLAADSAGTPVFSGTCEQNPNFGDGPVGDIEFDTDRVWQYCRVAADPTTTPGFVTVVADT